MKVKNVKKIVSVVVLAFAFIATIFVFDARGVFLTNSDDASELILGRLLAQENRIISPNWCYSTEIRFLNTNLFYSLLFHFTDDFQTVRAIGAILLRLTLLAAYFFFCRAIGVKKFFLPSSVLFLLPFSNAYSEVMLKFPYYIPHIVLAFLILTLFFNLQNTPPPDCFSLSGADLRLLSAFAVRE